MPGSTRSRTQSQWHNCWQLHTQGTEKAMKAARSVSDPNTPSPKPASTPLIARRIKKLLTQPPVSRNRSNAVHYLIQHPGTPHTADLQSFTSSHYAHSQVCFTPPCFRAPVYCAHGVQTVCLNPHATPANRNGVRDSLPLVCSLHRSLSCAAFLQAHATVWYKPTHFHCYFASPHHRLEAPGDFPPCLF